MKYSIVAINMSRERESVFQLLKQEMLKCHKNKIEKMVKVNKSTGRNTITY